MPESFAMRNRRRRRTVKSLVSRSANDTAPLCEQVPVAAPKHPEDEASLGLTLARLTPEERLICLWKRLGYSSREIARSQTRSTSAIDDLFRAAMAKIRR